MIVNVIVAQHHRRPSTQISHKPVVLGYIVDGFGSFWFVLLVVVGRFGQFWLVCWFSVVSAGFGWFWPVTGLSNYVSTNGVNYAIKLRIHNA